MEDYTATATTTNQNEAGQPTLPESHSQEIPNEHQQQPLMTNQKSELQLKAAVQQQRKRQARSAHGHRRRIRTKHELDRENDNWQPSHNPDVAEDPQRFLSEDFLLVLDEHRKNCEREGKLDEAQQARKRLKELRILEEQKRRVDTDQKHVS